MRLDGGFGKFILIRLLVIHLIRPVSIWTRDALYVFEDNDNDNDVSGVQFRE